MCITCIFTPSKILTVLNLRRKSHWNFLPCFLIQAIPTPIIAMHACSRTEDPYQRVFVVTCENVSHSLSKLYV